MLQTYYTIGGVKGDDPILCTSVISRYVRGEFECFLVYCKHLGKVMLEFTEGNTFAQIVLDTDTLKNHHKCLSVGSAFMEPKHHQVLSICLSMGRIKDGIGKSIQSSIDDVIDRAFGRSTLEISHSLMQDRTTG